MDAFTPYRCVVADPPWQPELHAENPRRRTRDKAGPQRFYATASVADICRMVPPMAEQAHVYIWGISAHFDWAYRVAAAWGVQPITMLTWCKPGMGVGRFQCNTEHVLVCRRGRREGNPFGFGGQHASPTGGTYFKWPRGRHSEKPDEFFALVESMSPGPRLEMFARKSRAGWDVWGNEAAGSIVMPHELEDMLR